MRGNRQLLLALGLALVSSACTKRMVTEVDLGTDGGPRPVDLGPVDMLLIPDATVDTCNPDGGMVALGGHCSVTGDCDDGCFCNGSELCMGGVCVGGMDPCSALTMQTCASTSCLEETNHCFVQPHDDRCSDGDACNGRETCDPMLGCLAAAPPECNDENPCTVDGCDPATGCTYSMRDLDMDGYIDGRCGGNDCNDLPPDGVTIHPGAMENCTNGRDDNCDGLRDFNDPSCLPTNDTCATARMLPGRGTYSGASRGLSGDYTLGCGGAMSTPDAVFTFTTTDVEDVRVAFAGSMGGQIALRDMAACATGPDLRCSSSGTAPSAFYRMLPAGTYAIIVKTTTSGSFDLTLTINAPTSPPVGDDCSHPVEVVPDGPVASTPTAGLGLDYSASCLSTTTATLRDTVFHFALATTRDVTINASAPSSWMFQMVTYVSGSPCGTGGTELRCHTAASSTDTEFFRSLPPGDYYVTVVSDQDTTATCQVATAPPTPIPPNDPCSGAIPLIGTVGSRTSDTLIGFADDRPAGSCEFSGPLPDAFYTFTLPAPAPVTLIVRSTVASFSQIYLFLRGATCGSGEVTGTCTSSTTSGSVQVATYVSSGSLPAGTYIVQVEQAAPQSNISVSWILM